MKIKTQYVLGFIFNPSLKCVALTRKQRPDWQRNKLNGMGGKVEAGEDFRTAMLREFREEIDYPNLASLRWTEFGALDGAEFFVSCFYTCGDLKQMKSKTDEPLEIVGLKSIGVICPAHFVENVPCLIACAIDRAKDLRPCFITIQY